MTGMNKANLIDRAMKLTLLPNPQVMVAVDALCESLRRARAPNAAGHTMPKASQTQFSQASSYTRNS